MVFALSMMVAGSCFAAIVGNVPDSEASLGGVTLGNSMSYVRSIYGAPTGQNRTKGHEKQDVMEYRYGKGFFIRESLYSYTIDEIITNANNGISTPMGVTVGVPKSTVDRLYGQGHIWDGAYRYLTDRGKRIQIQYGADANGVMVVKSIYVYYPA